MNLSKIRLVTFDVTGTLLKLRTSPGSQYGQVGAMYGVVADNNLLSENFKKNFKRMLLDYPNFGLQNGGWEKWWKTIVKESFKSSKLPFKEDKLEKIAVHLLDLYKTSVCWEFCYGVPGILSYLRSKNITMGVISNFDPRLDTILLNNKLKHYFKFVLTSYEVGIEKPDKRIFDLAIKESEVPSLKPEECLHIGDKPILDYAGAKNSGWNAFLVTQKDYNGLKKVIPDLDQDHLFTSAYQLHISLLRETGDKLPTVEQELG